MKKYISCFLATVLVILTLCSCNKNTNNTENESATAVMPTTESYSTPTPEELNGAVILAGSSAAVLEDGKTYTGKERLPLQEFRVEDPENTKGLSTESHGYSFGVSKDAKPPQTSVDNQKYFEEHNFKAFCLDTKETEKKVLYLTFDCGYENGYTAKILDTLKEKNVPSVFFCTLPQVKEHPDLIARMINEGHIVGNHSVHHPAFPTLSRTKMAEEIKGMDDYLRTNFGYSEAFFRFPEGKYSDSALDLVGSLGYTSVFWSVAYNDWDLNNQKGEEYAFQTVTARLHPGAVILLHSVSPDNAAALGRIIDRAREQGYEFKSLRDY